MGEALEALGINGPFLLSQIVNFLILFLALRFILWKPLMQRLEERREMLQQQREDAESTAEARDEIEEERQKVLEKARVEAEGIIDEAEVQAAAFKEKTLQEANQDADRLVKEAQQNAKEERNRILGEARSQIAALATAAAQRIIGQELDEQRQRTLVDSFFSGVREGQVEVMPEEFKGPSDGQITVISALPLTDEEKTTIHEDLKRRVNVDFDVIFQVDPEILGGLVLEIDNRVVDGSVVGQLERLKESLT